MGPWVSRGAIGAALALTIAARATAQGYSSLDRARASDILRTIRSELEQHYYDTTFGGLSLDSLFGAASHRVATVRSNAEAFAMIAEALLAFDDSHTFFLPPPRATWVKYGWRLQMVGDSCYVVAVQKGSDAARQGISVGDRVLAVDGVVPSRRDFWMLPYALQHIAPRPTVRLQVVAPAGTALDVRVTSRAIQRPPIRGLLDWTPSLLRAAEEGERATTQEYLALGDSILVWRMPTFELADASVDALVGRARHYSALVLDLRGNVGGFERAWVRLLGRMLRRDVVAARILHRDGSDSIVVRARDDRFAGGLVVLIDSESASAAEIFAHVVMTEGRGYVLGDRSAGAVMRSRQHVEMLGGNRAWLYELSVTVADIVMADGTRLEHRGVEPIEVVIPTAADLAAGSDPVLARALNLLGYDINPAAAGFLLLGSRRTGVTW